ncbi:hypothetical protein H1R20_g6645, partial [Candolleomyces eurysporus]
MHNAHIGATSNVDKAVFLNAQINLEISKKDISPSPLDLTCSLLKQIVTFKDRHHVNRQNTFGGQALGALWIAFMALVIWTAINERPISNLIGAYVDDSFGFNDKNDQLFYCPYSTFLPQSQVQLLKLWDKLGIPHKETKQVSGSPLTIISFGANLNTMMITLPVEAKKKLIDELEVWIKKPRKGSNNKGKLKLKRWQTLAGWVNWALNVYPWLRLALTESTQRCLGEKGLPPKFGLITLFILT